jgi:hypothetical protein
VEGSPRCPRIVGGDLEGDSLGGFVGWARADVGGPLRDALRHGVFHYPLIRASGETRWIIHSGDGEGESLWRARSDAPVSGATIILEPYGHGGAAIGIVRGGIGERTRGVDGGGGRKERGIGIF